MTTIPGGRLPCVWAIGVVALACSNSPETHPRTTVTDSSGITIVHNRSPHRSGVETWIIADTPSLDLGGATTDPSQELFYVAGAMRLDDGSIVVANDGTAELRFFGEDGTFLGTVGARGSGPGEFQTLSGLLRYGPDSIAVFDSELRRLTVYDLTGNFGRSATLLPAEGSGLLLVGAALGVFADRTLFLPTRDLFSVQRRPGAMRGTQPSIHVSETGTLLDSVGAFPGREMFMQTIEGGVRAVSRIFGRSTFYAVAGDNFFVGTNDWYEIARYSPTGVLRALIRTDHPRSPVQRGDREAFIQARFEGQSPAERQAYERGYGKSDH